MGQDSCRRPEHEVEALLLPTAPLAWKIDAMNGDQTPYGRAGGMAAVAGTPHPTVPMTQHWGLPVGLSLLGPRWGEARLLQLGAAFERARGTLPAPTLAASIEVGPVVAPMLAPAKDLPKTAWSPTQPVFDLFLQPSGFLFNEDKVKRRPTTSSRIFAAEIGRPRVVEP